MKLNVSQYCIKKERKKKLFRQGLNSTQNEKKGESEHANKANSGYHPPTQYLCC